MAARAADEEWQREPVVVAVANVLLDRRETGPAIRERPLKLKLDDAVYRGLFTGPASEADYHWSLLGQMERAGWIRLHVDPPRRGRNATAGYYRNPKAELADEEGLRHLTGRDRPDDVTRWRQTLVAAAVTALGDAQHPVVAMLARRAERFRLTDNAAEVADRLLRLREMDPASFLLREASSQLFWGHSKVLDQQEDLIAALLGVEECPFLQSPIQISVVMPHVECRSVLFVENLATFERLSRHGGPPETALVFASGYKGTARRLRSPTGASLYFRWPDLPNVQAAEHFARWLHRLDDIAAPMPVLFFGDLDYEGMGILKALRECFPGACTYRPGYEQLLALLGEGHSAEVASKTGQRDPGTTGCDYADDVLLPALRKAGRFVDQELLL